jgi:hypothetical protein
MIYLAYSFGSVLIIEILMTLMNLTVANSPMDFPKPFEFYPCSLNNSTQMIDCTNDPQFPFPFYLHSDFLKNNLKWTIFLGLDIQFF